jgi:hypothetical protein
VRENCVSTAARPAVSGYLPYQWTAGDSNPDFLVADQESCHWTNSPFVSSSAVAPSCSPRPGGSQLIDQGGNRTHRITRLSTSPLFQFAYSVVSSNKWRVRESHPTVKAYETPMGTGPPAMTVCRLTVAGIGSPESVPIVSSFGSYSSRYRTRPYQASVVRAPGRS